VTTVAKKIQRTIINKIFFFFGISLVRQTMSRILIEFVEEKKIKKK
jgi:hypothetical protein